MSKQDRIFICFVGLWMIAVSAGLYYSWRSEFVNTFMIMIMAIYISYLNLYRIVCKHRIVNTSSILHSEGECARCGTAMIFVDANKGWVEK